MIQQLIQYPTPLSLKYATDVRSFDDDLFALIDDLKDTMNENNLDGLSAFQIGNYYNVVVVKDENGEFLELINPRLIAHKGRVTTVESTTYYPGRTAEIERYEEVSIVYQDRFGKDQSLKTTGNLAIVIQRKIDYTFGATFIQKMSPEVRDRFESGLDFGADVGIADYCPTEFQRDKILKVIRFTMIAMLLALLGSFFVDDAQQREMLWEYELYGSYGVLFLDIVYFFYAQYEGKKYVSCTSCQIGNIIGTLFIALIQLTILMSAVYFFLSPA